MHRQHHPPSACLCPQSSHLVPVHQKAAEVAADLGVEFDKTIMHLLDINNNNWFCIVLDPKKAQSTCEELNTKYISKIYFTIRLPLGQVHEPNNMK